MIVSKLSSLVRGQSAPVSTPTKPNSRNAVNKFLSECFSDVPFSANLLATPHPSIGSTTSILDFEFKASYYDNLELIDVASTESTTMLVLSTLVVFPWHRPATPLPTFK